MQQCKQCKTFRFPPANICASCSSDQYDWHALSGRGIIWSYCVFHKDYFPNESRKIPYVVVLIQLEEGPRVFSNMTDVDVNSLQIGLPVRAIFEDQPNAETLLRFRLAGGDT
ncbi:Zn-ribbon domain-containing OB-fold protein [Allopusillimonas soli]